MSKRSDLDPSTPSDSLTSRNEFSMDEQPRPRRRWLRWCSFLAIGLFLCVLFAPTVVTKTRLRDFFIAAVIPQDAGSLVIDSVDVGWLSPLRMQGIRFSDATGSPLLSAEQVAGDRSLFDLAMAPTDIGSIVVTKPVVQLQLRKDGSNLEDVIAKLTPASTSEPVEQSSESSSASISAHVKILDAQVIATEMQTQQTWKLEAVDVEATLPEAIEADWLVSAKGALDGKPFEVKFTTPLGQATQEWPLGPTGNATVQAQALPLAPLRYAALRAGQTLDQLEGAFTSNITASWLPEPGGAIPQFTANGLVRTDHLLVASNELLGPDVLRLSSGQLDTKIRIAKNVATIEQGNFRSDYGNASLVTAVKLDGLQDVNAILETLRQQRLSTRGEIDLAALTRALPNTFKIRDDVQIESGRITWSVESNSQPGNAAKWTGGLNTADVKVVRNGQLIDWQFPLEVRFSAVDGAEIQLESLSAVSDFFALSGQGKLRSGKIQAQANLERLVYQLSQVMDLSNIYVRGQMQSVLQWNELQPNQLKLDGRTRLLNFAMTQNEQLLCEEAELNATTQATATLNGQQVASLDSARVDVISVGDFMVAELQQPVTQPGPESNWELACRLKGELANWVGRLKTMGVGLDWQVAGQIDATARLSANPKTATVQSMNVDIRNLQANSEGVQIDEPVIQIQTAGHVDLVSMDSRFPKTTISSQSISCTASDLAVSMQPSFMVSGNLGYRADLARLSAIVPSESQQTLTGAAVGQLVLEAKDANTAIDLNGWIENLIVKDAANATLWEEPKLTTQVTGAYDGLVDSLDLKQIQIAGRVVNLSAAGRATDLTSNVGIDLSGEYGYDLAGLLIIFRDLVGPDIELTGRQRQRFVAKGPLFPTAPETGIVATQFSAQAGLGWDSANAYGIPLGPGQLDAAVANGVMQVNPLELAVGQGLVRLAPTVHLNTEAMWMTLPPGPVIDNVRLDPQMTGGWMKYVAPLMADAASAEGTFSVVLNRTEVPLMDPTKGRVEGQFMIHGGALGPGPMASQLLDLATQIKQLRGKGTSRVADPTKSWVQLDEQRIDFQMSEGRVYHSGFQMMVDDVPIRTRGSVGIEDQSLAVMAEVPILDEWIDGTPYLAGLRGQVISVPIGGTTSNPQLDRDALRRTTMQLTSQGAAGYLQGKLNEKLGGKLQSALGDSLGGLLGSGDTQANPQAARAQQPQQDLGTQLQEKAQEEFSRQLNKIFK